MVADNTEGSTERICIRSTDRYRRSSSGGFCNTDGSLFCSIYSNSTRTSGGDGDYSPPRDELPQCVTRSSSEAGAHR